MKKFLAFLLALTMLLGVGALAEEDAPLFQQDVMVLFTSDVHCGIESNFGYAGLAMVRDAYKNAGYHVLLVDNGDSIQGEPVGTMTTGEANIKLMNAVGYDIATMGNHEFSTAWSASSNCPRWPISPMSAATSTRAANCSSLLMSSRSSTA